MLLLNTINYFTGVFDLNVNGCKSIVLFGFKQIMSYFCSKMKKAYLNILIYTSIVFLFIYLYKFDYFAFKDVKFDFWILVLSTFLLWSGYLLSALSWYNILTKYRFKVTVRQAVISHGLAIFAKYIPGKIWVIIGRAGYFSKFGYSLKTTSFLSLKEQLIYVWEGLLISTIPMLYIYGLTLFTLFVFLLCLFFTFLLFSEAFHYWFLRTFKRITKKELNLPYLKFRDSGSIMLYVLLYWIVWLFAFRFFVLAFFNNAGFQVAFAFPLSVTLGLLAVIFPGGIGIREGILSGYLISSGIPLEIATVIAVYARLWFISGEIFIFLTAFIFSKLHS